VLIPPDFPLALVDSVHQRLYAGVASLIGPAFPLFAGAWKRSASRFTLCAEKDNAFRVLLEVTPTSDSLESELARYEQDKALFVFLAHYSCTWHQGL